MSAMSDERKPWEIPTHYTHEAPPASVNPPTEETVLDSDASGETGDVLEIEPTAEEVESYMGSLDEPSEDEQDDGEPEEDIIGDEWNDDDDENDLEDGV